MKKTLFLLLLIAAVARVSAQNIVTSTPYYARPSAELYKKYMDKDMVDSITRTFKVQPNYILPGNDSSRKHNSTGYSMSINVYAYNMPVIRIGGNSKMPIIKTQGNSKMPVVDPNGVNRNLELNKVKP